MFVELTIATEFKLYYLRYISKKSINITHQIRQVKTNEALVKWRTSVRSVIWTEN